MSRRTRPRLAENRRAHSGAGFTLLELIIVIAVFAVLAAMAYGGLQAVLNTRAHVEASLARTQQYQKAYLLLRQDFQNATNRGARDVDGVARPAMFYDPYSHRLEFTRGGWSNPLGLPRPGLERLNYRYEDDKLIRSTWRALDVAPRATPVDVVLLDGIDELRWRFLSPQLQWSEQWPPEDAANNSAYSGSSTLNAAQTATPPAAVELTMRTRDWGEIRLLFKLGYDPESLLQTTKSASGGAQSGADNNSGSNGSNGSSNGSGGTRLPNNPDPE